MPEPKPTAWAHLPNARHIDGILADAKARPAAWAAVWGPVKHKLWTSAVGVAQARRSTDAEAWDAVWAAVGPVAVGAGWLTVWSALRALIAWPASARMLYMTPAALRTLIDITEGDVRHQAVLILPAVLAGYVPTEGRLHGVT